MSDKSDFLTLFLLAKTLAVERFIASDKVGAIAAQCNMAFLLNRNPPVSELGSVVGRYIGMLEQEVDVLNELMGLEDVPDGADETARAKWMDRRAELAAVRVTWRGLTRRFQSNDRRFEAIRALTWVSAGSPADFPRPD